MHPMKSIIISLFISTCVVLLPVKPFLITVGCFVLFDTLVGIYATIKINGVKSFRSHKFFNIAIKSFFYFGAIILGFLVDKYIAEGTILGIKLLITKAVSVLFIYGELLSINENSMKLGNKSIWALVQELVAKGKSLKQDINGVIKDEEENEPVK